MEISLETLGKNLDMMKRLIFSAVFIEENKLETALNRNMKDITSKQWLLLVIASSFPEPPSLTEVGQQMGCSRQNVKKIASILEKNGYIELKDNLRENRATCIIIKEKFKEFSEAMEKDTEKVFSILYKGFTEDQIKEFYKLTCMFSKNIDDLGNYFMEKK
mgnify:CR=1 FL=1